MCGRSACTLNPSTIRQRFHVTEWRDQNKFKTSFNAGPNTFQPVLIQDSETQNIVCCSMRWGLIPCYWHEPVVRDLHTINARVETVTTNKFWKRLVDSQRCVVLADGYFEWKRDKNGNKQPFFFRFGETGRPLTMAGLFDCWIYPETQEKLYTYSIVTTDAIPEISHIHDRMPLILDTDEKISMWLDCAQFPAEKVLRFIFPPRVKKQETTESVASDVKPDLEPLVKSEESKPSLEAKEYKPSIIFYEVPKVVNSVKNDTPDCVKPMKEFDKTKGSIASFFTKVEKPSVKKEEPKMAHPKIEIKPDPDEFIDYLDQMPELEELTNSVEIPRDPINNNAAHARETASDEEPIAKRRKEV